MKYILYCRKSTESEDRQTMSLDAQENELRIIAERDEIEIVKVFHESMSAKAPGRPLFTEMIQMISTGKADGILCWKLDRLARNPVDGGTISWMLQNEKIKCIQTYQKQYLPTDDVIYMSIEFGVSNQDIRNLSMNVKRGNREKLRRGEWPNHAPYGYKNNKATKTLVVSKYEAQNVKDTYDLYATGSYSYSDIAKKIGIRKSLVERILGKTFYYGLMERNGEYFPGIHKAIITKEIYEQAQEVKEKVTVTNRSRPKILIFPYRGIMKCAECDCQLTATRKKQKYDYYYCTNGKHTCTQHKEYLTEKQVEQFYITALEKLTFDEELIEIMYEASIEKLQSTKEINIEKQEVIQKEIERIERAEIKLSQSYTSELIEENLYRAEAKRMKTEKEFLNKKLLAETKTNEQKLATLELTKKVFLESSRAISEFKEANPEKKQKIAQNLLWNFSVKDKKVLEYNYKSTYQPIANAPKNGDFATMLPDRGSNPDYWYQKPVSYH